LYYDSTKPDNDTYVGDVGSTPGQNVWSNNYLYVWHFDEDPSWGSNCMKDSTNSSNHGTPGGSMSMGDRIEEAKIGRATEFDGSDDYISLTDTNTAEIKSTANWTAEFVFKTADTGSGGTYDFKGPFYSKGDAATQHLHMGVNNSKLVLEWYDAGTHSISSNTSVCDNNWRHGTIVGRSNGNAYLYVNGDYENSGAWTHTVTCVEERLGDSYNGGVSTDNYDGILDEARISDTNRSSEWIKTAYHSDFDNLITFGSPQALSGFISYVEGQCTDRYGVPMSTACDVIVMDDDTYEVLGYGLSVSGTGRFSVEVTGTAAGSDVLVAYSYRGNYGSVSDLAGAEFMTTVSGGS
jgi:hypothetical protein